MPTIRLTPVGAARRRPLRRPSGRDLRRGLVAGLLVVAVRAPAAVLQVDHDAPDAYRDLGSAVADARDGDVIRIGPGVHAASVVVARSLVIEGAGATQGTALDGGGVRRMLTVIDGAEVVVRGLRLQNGRHVGGGGALMVALGAQVTVEDCAFVDNASDFEGAAAHVRNPGSTLHLERVFFHRNRGAHAAGAVDAALQSRLEVIDCGFLDNVATDGAGALAAHDAQLDVRGSVFHGNRGAGVAVLSLRGAWGAMRNCTLDENAGADAAILADSGTTFTIERCIVSATEGGTGISIHRAAEIDLACNVYWANDGGSLRGATIHDHSLEADPRFCDPTADVPVLSLWVMSPAAQAFSPCGARVGAYPVACRMPTDAPSTAHRDPLRPSRR